MAANYPAYILNPLRGDLISRNILQLKLRLTFANALLDRLLGASVISEIEKMHIERPSATDFEKAEDLWKIMRRCDNSKYQTFLEILEREQNELASLLNQGLPDPPAEDPTEPEDNHDGPHDYYS